MLVRNFLSNFRPSDHIIVFSGNNVSWRASVLVVTENIGDMYVLRAETVPGGAIGIYVV